MFSWTQCAPRHEGDLRYDRRKYPNIDLSMNEPRNRAPVPTRGAESITFLTCADRLYLGEYNVIQGLIKSEGEYDAFQCI